MHTKVLYYSKGVSTPFFSVTVIEYFFSVSVLSCCIYETHISSMCEQCRERRQSWRSGGSWVQVIIIALPIDGKWKKDLQERGLTEG